MAGKAPTPRLLRVLGANVRTARLALELSQHALADAAGIDQQHISRIERGELNVKILTVEAIAKALRVPTAQLLV